MLDLIFNFENLEIVTTQVLLTFKFDALKYGDMGCFF